MHVSMSASVKSKLQKLIRDLEGGSSAEQPGEDTEHGTLEGEGSSVSLGLSDITKTDTTGSSDTTPGSHQVQRPGSSGFKRHVAELEGKVLELLLERKAVDARHARELSLRDAELARLQQYIDEELTELHQRQAQVEESAPTVRLQLQEARASLRNLTISEEKYQQLKKVPSDQLLLADAVRLAVYEATRDLSSENEALRISAAAAREAAGRAEGDVSRLQRENARLAATVADKEADVESTVLGLQSRIARLSSELEDVAVQLEVAKAKAAMYDELQDKADRLESEVARLSGAEAAAERLRTQLAAADAAVSEKDSTLALLISDKAYLSKEVQVCEERLSQLSMRLSQAEDKVSQLKAERQELYQKLAQVNEANRAQDEGRWEREVVRLQATAAADLERIRMEAADTAEREARMLRDLRDAALDEASRAKSELRQLRLAHEELLLSSREAAARADVSHSELLGEIKLKGFELTRLQALSDERGNSVQQLTLQVEMLTEKVQLLTAELSQQERDSRELVADLQQQLGRCQAQLREYQSADGLLDQAIMGAATAGDGAVSGLQEQLAALLPPGPAVALAEAAASASSQAAGQQQHQQLAGALQRRIQHNIQLAARCAKLENEKQQLAREKADMQGKLSKAQAAVEKLHSQLQLAGQPHGYLLAKLASAEAAASSAEDKLKEAQAELHAKEEAVQEAAVERSALRRDLERILRERGALESMRRLVATAVASASTAAAQQQVAETGSGAAHRVAGR